MPRTASRAGFPQAGLHYVTYLVSDLSWEHWCSSPSYWATKWVEADLQQGNGYALLGPYVATFGKKKNGLGRIFLSLLLGSGTSLLPGESWKSCTGCWCLLLSHHALSAWHTHTVAHCWMSKWRDLADQHVYYLPLEWTWLPWVYNQIITLASAQLGLFLKEFFSKTCPLERIQMGLLS